MKGTEARLIEFMEGSKKRFIIPVYQRNYDWKIENCKQLYDDLVKVVKYQRKNHFFGSMVSAYNLDGRYTEYLVIDGQQRLTTVSLLLLAMYHLLQQNIVSANTHSLAQQIYEDFLVDKYQEKETRLKLKPVKKDQLAFNNLFDEDSKLIADSNLTMNYQYFYERMQKAEISIDELFNAVCALEIIDIKLNAEDDAQRIFESLNSTGLALSEGDKIRNFMLMGQTSRNQEVYHEKYWSKIEEYTDFEVSSFVRDYLSVKQQATPAIMKVYFIFKIYVEDNRLNVEELLIDLLSYAKLYQILLHGNTEDRKLKSCIERLNRLETTVTRPFFLEVLRLKYDNLLSNKDVENIFYLTENYLFRRTICELPTNMLNKIFLSLHKEVMKYDGTAENYVEKLSYALLSKKDRARFPSNFEFSTSISTKSIYQMNSKNKIYLMERFENFGTLEDKNIWQHFEQGDYSIEHIMPQKLTAHWIVELGNDYEMIYETWLHRLANLTLTAYNSTYSNKSFVEKRDMNNGFKFSGIRMNQRIAQKERWGLKELEERNEYMQQRALEIWSLPQTSYKPFIKQLDAVSLEEDEILTGRQIIKFSFKNIEYSVESWVEMFQRVIQILHFEDKSILKKLVQASTESTELAKYVGNSESLLRSIAIDEGIYIETNTSTASKLVLLKKFFRLYGADPSDLVFYLKDGTIQDVD